MIEEKIRKIIGEGLEKLGVESPEVSLEHPDDVSNGDYSTSAALAYAKKLKVNPKKLSEEIVRYIVQKKPEEIEKVEVAGPGFINFYLARDFFTKQVEVIVKNPENFGKSASLAGQKIMVDYTDPNPFKEFHIGHLMSNAIGESICRVFESSGAKVVRVCYQGDVGLHVAKALWGVLQNKAGLPDDSSPLSEKTAYLGAAYALGSQKYEDDPKAAVEIKEINKKVFEKSDGEINALYEKGRKWSLLHFDEIYKKLGTEFNHIIPESSVIDDGRKIVEEFLNKEVFEKSEGAVIFRGEKYGLHTRVFISSQGLPTYETKDMGLAKKKLELDKDLSDSVIVTANEQNEYFKVVFKALSFIFPEYAKISKHVGHGMLRFTSGKMSSRKGNVITGESLISAVEAMVHKKLEERELETTEKNKIAEIVAIGAIKYSILRQAIGSDIIYDFDKSISFEGDSGPYLQYSYVRAKSVLAKAEKEGVKTAATQPPREGASLLERLLYRFPDIVERAGKEYAPHLIATYLIELAGAFNSYYAQNQIVNSSDPDSSYRVALTSAFATVMKNGLWLLGIGAPERM